MRFLLILSMTPLINAYSFFANAFKLVPHPSEPRCAFVYDFDMRNAKAYKEELLELFERTPLIVFRQDKTNHVSLHPQEFIDFLTLFDPDCDMDAIRDPKKYPMQMLQPFDQFPDCPHVAPRGNSKIDAFHGIRDISVKPSEPFVNNYLWHTDLLGHPYKLPGVVTGFHIVKTPLIGGETDFISGETIYESMSDEVRNASRCILTEVNRPKFVVSRRVMDYSGSYKLAEQPLTNKTSLVEDRAYAPIVFAPESVSQSPRVLLLPSFFEGVVGWSEQESQAWIRHYMHEYVLPHRFSVAWKRGDVAVFNNRRFMHSSTPARNYLDHAGHNERLLLQTFLPTRRSLYGYKPPYSYFDLLHKLGWCDSEEKSKEASNQMFKYALCSMLYHTTQNMDSNRWNVNPNKFYVSASLPKSTEKNEILDFIYDAKFLKM